MSQAWRQRRGIRARRRGATSLTIVRGQRHQQLDLPVQICTLGHAPLLDESFGNDTEQTPKIKWPQSRSPTSAPFGETAPKRSRGDLERRRILGRRLALIPQLLVDLAEPNVHLSFPPRWLAEPRRVGGEQLDSALQRLHGDLWPAAVLGRRVERGDAAEEPHAWVGRIC